MIELYFYVYNNNSFSGIELKAKRAIGIRVEWTCAVVFMAHHEQPRVPDEDYPKLTESKQGQNNGEKSTGIHPSEVPI